MSDRLSHSVHLVVDAHVHVTGLILQSALFPSSKAHSPLIDRNKEQTRLRIICRWEQFVPPSSPGIIGSTAAPPVFGFISSLTMGLHVLGSRPFAQLIPSTI